MQTLEAITRQITSAQDLQSVVKTMKALAAVNIRQYEKAIESLAVYHRTLELGLHVVLSAGPERSMLTQASSEARLGVLVVGSDQGMCGVLNEQIAAYALQSLEQLGARPEERTVAVLGTRVAAHLAEAGQIIERCFAVPTSLAGIAPAVQDILLHCEAWYTQQHLARMVLLYTRHLSSTVFRPSTVHLLPLHQGWLSSLALEAWPTRVLPTFSMDREQLCSALLRQYLFVALYRALAESLASENASRLAAMQGAAKNIDEHLTELQAQFRQQRQAAITAELLDIVAGFEVLMQT